MTIKRSIRKVASTIARTDPVPQPLCDAMRMVLRSVAGAEDE